MNAAELRHKEHRLAQKARDIYQRQHELQSLKEQKATLLKQKPAVDKEQLSYLESVQFSKKINQYKNKLKDIDINIQKLSRELKALKKQALKLLPAAGVKIEVSTPPDDNTPVQAFCIRYIKSESSDQTEDQFQIHPIKE